jgi:hypothetical protein
MSVYGNMSRCVNADFYITGTDIEDCHLNFVADNQTFILFSCEYQHPCCYLQSDLRPALKEAMTRLPELLPLPALHHLKEDA